MKLMNNEVEKSKTIFLVCLFVYYYCNEESVVDEHKEEEAELRMLKNMDEVHEVVEESRE